MYFPRPLRPSLKWILAVAMLAIATPQVAQAEALLVVEADTGKVLQADNATMPWYPASLSKLMTAYVTLKAVKDGRVSLDTLLTVSPTASSQSPSKMGLRPGTQVTVDNALKMMLVKSANDMAVVLAEGDIIGASEFPQVAAQIAQAPFAPASSAELPHIMSAPAMVEVHHAHDGGAAPSVQATPGTLALLDSHGDVRPLEELEFETIRFAIAHYRGQMSEVARRLRIGRSTLYRKLEHLGIEEHPKEPA